MASMIHVLRLALILALTFGAVIAPKGSSASMADIAMVHMDTAGSADQRCDGCGPEGYVSGVTCEGGCPVPCGSMGAAGIIGQASSGRFAILFDLIVSVDEPLIPRGVSPSLDPFPPKLPI